ncbi:MAG: hypothetical protein QOC58_1904, partial [Mycobacterium sp.]|nr:hypothetical protein [Mycobacterium sp.]
SPLVESGIPHGSFLVAVVVDGAVSPWPAGRRKRPVPIRPWRLTRSPRCGPVAPWRAVEVTPMVISMPHPGSAGAAGVIPRSARSAGVVRPGSAGSTGVVRPGSAGSAWTAGSARTAGRLWRRPAVATGGRRTVAACRALVRPAWVGECRTGARAQRCRAESAGYGCPPDQLLQCHGPHLSTRERLDT